MEDMELIQQSTTPLYLTPEGYKSLQAELEHLTLSKRAEIAERLRDSKMHGEFSEDNSELDEVKFEQAIVENRIAELKQLFSQAMILDPETIPKDMVSIGSYATIKDAERNIEFEIRMVSSFEANPDEDLISNESPLGIALIGRKVGDEVVFEAPAGKLKYKITKIRK